MKKLAFLILASSMVVPASSVAQAPPSANQVYAGPASGPGATASFRALVPADVPAAALPNGQLFIGNVSNLAAAQALSGDCTITNAGVITCTKTNGTSFAPSATTDTTNAANISSGTLPAGRAPAFTGDVTSSGGSLTLTLAWISRVTGKTVTFNNTLTFAGTDATTMTFPSTNGTIAALNIADQTVTGGANVTSQSQSTGNISVDCGSRPLQFITNGGAYTITAPSSDGSCILLSTNNGSAGAVSFSGFSVGSSTGDALDTTNGHKFSIFIWRINGTSGYRVAAHQ